MRDDTAGANAPAGGVSPDANDRSAAVGSQPITADGHRADATRGDGGAVSEAGDRRTRVDLEEDDMARLHSARQRRGVHWSVAVSREAACVGTEGTRAEAVNARSEGGHVRAVRRAGSGAPRACRACARISAPACRTRPGTPAGALRESIAGLGAAAPCCRRCHRAAKAAHRRPAGRSVAMAARRRTQLVRACNGVEQAHAVSGWRISEGARACGADGSTSPGGPGEALRALSRAPHVRAVRRAGSGAPRASRACPT